MVVTTAYMDAGPWTIAELMALPEDGHRYELVDGRLIMNPPPSPQHQGLSLALARLLQDAADATGVAVRVLEAVGLRCDEQLLIPDVVVVDAYSPSLNKPLLTKEDVHCAIEIVSAGSRAQDRGEKPYLYAEAGIPHYWRVETANYRGRKHALPVVVRYELVGIAEYAIKHTNGAGETLRADEPIPVEFDPATLTPF